MAVSRVRSVAQVTTLSGTTQAYTSLPAIIPIGDTVVIWVCIASGTSAVTCADNSSQTGTANTWTKQIDSGSTSAFKRLVGIVCTLTRSILTSDTITVTYPSGGSVGRAVQYTGASAFDATSTAKAISSATSVTTNNVTTVASGGMAIAAMALLSTSNIVTVGTVGGGTATTGSTSLEGETSNSSAFDVSDEDATFSTQGTINGTFTFTTASGVCAIISLAVGAQSATATPGNIGLSLTPNAATATGNALNSTGNITLTLSPKTQAAGPVVFGLPGSITESLALNSASTSTLAIATPGRISLILFANQPITQYDSPGYIVGGIYSTVKEDPNTVVINAESLTIFTNNSISHINKSTQSVTFGSPVSRIGA